MERPLNSRGFPLGPLPGFQGCLCEGEGWCRHGLVCPYTHPEEWIATGSSWEEGQVVALEAAGLRLSLEGQETLLPFGSDAWPRFSLLPQPGDVVELRRSPGAAASREALGASPKSAGGPAAAGKGELSPKSAGPSPGKGEALPKSPSAKSEASPKRSAGASRSKSLGPARAAEPPAGKGAPGGKGGKGSEAAKGKAAPPKILQLRLVAGSSEPRRVRCGAVADGAGWALSDLPVALPARIEQADLRYPDQDVLTTGCRVSAQLVLDREGARLLARDALVDAPSSVLALEESEAYAKKSVEGSLELPAALTSKEIAAQALRSWTAADREFSEIADSNEQLSRGSSIARTGLLTASVTALETLFPALIREAFERLAFLLPGRLTLETVREESPLGQLLRHSMAYLVDAAHGGSKKELELHSNCIEQGRRATTMLYDRKEALVRQLKRWDADCLRPLKKIPELPAALKQQSWEKVRKYLSDVGKEVPEDHERGEPDFERYVSWCEDKVRAIQEEIEWNYWEIVPCLIVGQRFTGPSAVLPPRDDCPLLLAPCLDCAEGGCHFCPFCLERVCAEHRICRVAGDPHPQTLDGQLRRIVALTAAIVIGEHSPRLELEAERLHTTGTWRRSSELYDVLRRLYPFEELEELLSEELLQHSLLVLRREARLELGGPGLWGVAQLLNLLYGWRCWKAQTPAPATLSSSSADMARALMGLPPLPTSPTSAAPADSGFDGVWSIVSGGERLRERLLVIEGSGQATCRVRLGAAATSGRLQGQRLVFRQHEGVDVEELRSGKPHRWTEVWLELDLEDSERALGELLLRGDDALRLPGQERDLFCTRVELIRQRQDPEEEREVAELVDYWQRRFTPGPQDPVTRQDVANTLRFTRTLAGVLHNALRQLLLDTFGVEVAVELSRD